MPQYTQAEIDEAVRRVNAGEITVAELTAQHPEAGLSVDQVQNNINVINERNGYVAPTRRPTPVQVNRSAPTTSRSTSGYPFYNKGSLDIFNTPDNRGEGRDALWDELYSTDSNPDAVFGGLWGLADTTLGPLSEYTPVPRDRIGDTEGTNEVVDIKQAMLGDAVFQIENSGATDAEKVEAVAELLRDTGMSSEAIAQVSAFDVNDINESLANAGYDTRGYDPYSREHGSYNPTGTGSGFDDDGLTAVNQPDDPATVAGGGGGGGAAPNNNTGGEAGGEASPSEQGNGEDDVVVDEHTWVYQGGGVFVDNRTGESRTVDTRGIPFIVGEVYSAGNGQVRDAAGEQVAQVDTDGNGINVLVGVNGPDGAFDAVGDQPGTGSGNGTGGSGSGDGDGAGDGTGGDGNGPSGPAGNGGGTGGPDGGGSGLSAGNGGSLTPITDGMFADFVPKFRRQISGNLLNPKFRA